MFLKIVRRLGKNDRGASLVEFAIVALLFFALIFGIIEFGWIFHGYVTLTGAVREGVRLAVVMEDFNEAVIKNAIKEHARIFQLEDSDITISSAGFNEEREIKAAGDLSLLISFPPFPQSISLEASATMRQEQ